MPNVVESKQGSFWQRNLVVVFVLGMIATMPLLWIFGNTTEISPDRNDIVMTGALFLGISAGIAFSLAIVIIKPESRASTAVTAISFFFVGLIMGTLVGMALINEAIQLIDFSGARLTRRVEDFAIARAYKTHGKNACDHIQLRDYFGDFCIDSREYQIVFADRDDTPSSGYCLHADTERNGAAIRIMHGSSSAFGRGAVVRCSS